MPPFLATLLAVPWLHDLLTRLWRQAYQTALPILYATLSAGRVEPVALVTALAAAEVVTLAKFAVVELRDWHLEGSAWWVLLLDRAVPAFGGVLAGLGFTTWRDLVTVDWQQALSLAAVAALVAVLDRGLNAPRVVQGEVLASSSTLPRDAAGSA